MVGTLISSFRSQHGGCGARRVSIFEASIRPSGVDSVGLSMLTAATKRPLARRVSIFEASMASTAEQNAL